MFSFSQNMLLILITGTDARKFCYYLSYVISTNSIKTTQEIFFFVCGGLALIVSQKVNQERGLGEQISAQVLMLLDEGGGGCEVEKNAVVGLSLSDLLRIRTGSPLRVFQC